MVRYSVDGVRAVVLPKAVAAMSADDRTATNLSRLGVNPITIARLRGYACEDDMALRDLVRYILSDYAPPQEAAADDQAHNTPVVHLDDRRR